MMRLPLPLTLLFLCAFFFASAQKERLVGKVIDGKTGNVLSGATITLNPGNKSTLSDLNGYYAINGLTQGTYTLAANYVSYKAQTLTVSVQKGQENVQDIVLVPAATELTGVTVKSKKVNRESVSALLAQQKNRSSISDGISAEVIRKTPDRSAGDVLKRVSGASLQDDKFAVIRGLNDRYNNGLLNGSPLPSSESARKAFAFDIFPANLLDNIVIAKTATPDLPGEFVGGVIMVNTKSVSDQNFQSFAVSGGYNTLTTFKDKIGYKGGRWNYLGSEDFNGYFPDKVDFPILFPKQESLAKKFVNNWGLTSGKYSPNIGFQYTIGQNIQAEGKDFIGMLISLTYNSANSLYDINRKVFENATADPNSPSVKTTDYTNTIHSTKVLAGLLANFSMKLNNNNILNFKNVANWNTDDRLIRRVGERDINPLDNTGVSIIQNARVFNGNRFYSSQLEGQHYVPASLTKINWSVFYSNVYRTNPSRNDTYTADINDNNIYKAQLGDGANDNDAGTMKTIQTDENIKGVQIDITQRLKPGKHLITEFKAGFSYQMRNRFFESRRFGFAPGSTFNYSLITLPIDSLFAPENMGKGGFKVIDRTAPFDKYDGNTSTLAYYAMADQRFFKLLRLIYGVRIEHFNMKLNSVKTDFVTPLNYDRQVNTVLPSINAVFSITDKQNIRLCYSKTVNRPEFREVAPFLFYDYSTGFTISGTDTLQAAKVDNFDIRYEIYPGRSQVLSVTGFYKKFDAPIEAVYQENAVNPNIVYQNSKPATNLGVEAEIRVLMGALLNKKGAFLNNLTVMANYAYIKSKVSVRAYDEVFRERQLQGQSPYVFNGGLIYNDEKNGFGIATFINRAGPRIFYGGNNYFPDVWENGRTTLDVQLSKTFLKQKLDIRLNAKDLLRQKLYFFEDRNNNKKLDLNDDNLVQTTTFASQISLNISYRF